VAHLSRGAIYLGRHHQREDQVDQVLPRDLAAGPAVHHGGRVYYHFSAGSIPLHHAEN
jgi:hypothetical protein